MPAKRPGLRKLSLNGLQASLIKGQAKRAVGAIKQFKGSRIIKRSQTERKYAPDYLNGRLLLAEGERQNAKGRRRVAIYGRGIRTKTTDVNEVLNRQKAIKASKIARAQVKEAEQEISFLKRKKGGFL